MANYEIKNYGKRGPKKGTLPKNFLEFQRKGQESNIGRKPWNDGKIGVFSEKTLEKMSEAKKGKPRSGNPKNWKHTEETKEKCRKANLGKRLSPKTEFKKGYDITKHWNWKDGLSKMPGYNTFISMRRRVRKLGNGGFHTLKQWQELKKFYNYMCLCCKEFEPKIKLTEDHIIPLDKGGSDNIENIQPLCKSCNSRKHIKIIKYKNEPRF